MPRTPSSSTGVEACCTIATRGICEPPVVRWLRSESRRTAEATTISVTPRAKRLAADQISAMKGSTGGRHCKGGLVRLAPNPCQWGQAPPALGSGACPQRQWQKLLRKRQGGGGEFGGSRRGPPRQLPP